MVRADNIHFVVDHLLLEGLSEGLPHPKAFALDRVRVID